VQDIGQNAGYESSRRATRATFCNKPVTGTRRCPDDLQMPDVDGVELLRAMSADKLNAPIVLMSGSMTKCCARSAI